MLCWLFAWTSIWIYFVNEILTVDLLCDLSFHWLYHWSLFFHYFYMSIRFGLDIACVCVAVWVVVIIKQRVCYFLSLYELQTYMKLSLTKRTKKILPYMCSSCNEGLANIKGLSDFCMSSVASRRAPRHVITASLIGIWPTDSSLNT